MSNKFYTSKYDLNKDELDVIEKDEFMEENKNRIEKLNEDKTFVSAMTYEEDQKLILNTEKMISFKEGIQKGSEKTQEDIIKRLYEQNFTKEQISTIVELPIEKIKDILNAD